MHSNCFCDWPSKSCAQLMLPCRVHSTSSFHCFEDASDDITYCNNGGGKPMVGSYCLLCRWFWSNGRVHHSLRQNYR